MFAFNCPRCGAQLLFREASPGMNVKCPHCGSIVQAPDGLSVVASPPDPTTLAGGGRPAQPAKRRRPILGMLSLFAFCGAATIGIFMTMSIASHTKEMASLGAIAGIGLGCMVSVLSLTLAAIGIAREETPRWPALLGMALSLLPAGIGIWMLWKLLESWYIG